MSEEVIRIYEEATVRDGFYLYDRETIRKTDEIAYQMRSIKCHGL